MTTFGIPNSVLYNTFLMAGTQALGILTAPGPRRATKEDLSINPGDAANVWPYIAGTVLMTPHLITYFDFSSKKVKNDVGIDEILLSAGLSALGAGLATEAALPDVAGVSPPGKFAKVSQAATLGGLIGGFTAGLSAIRTESYRYYCGFAYGVCHGPIDAIEEVQAGDRAVFINGTNNAGGTLLIDDPQAWGGDHKEGGMYALCDVVRGDYWPTQAPNSYLVAQLGASVPAYSGKALFVIRGPSGYRESGYFSATAGDAPFLRPLKLRVKRLPDNLGVPAYKAINTHDANPAECCYEWLTSASFGAKKIAATKIDRASFQAGALTHFTEGLGFSDEINSETDVETALDMFCAHSNCIIFGGFRSPGSIKYKAIRRDYSIATLPVFTRGYASTVTTAATYNVIRTEGYTPGAWAETANDFRFEYTDRDNKFQRTTRHAQDLANRMIQGRTVPLSVGLRGVSTGATAALVGTREMRAGSYPRPPLTLVVNRDGYALEPGSVLKYVDNVDSLSKILRVAEVTQTGAANGEIKLVCTEDVY
nr:hypothetical protein [Acidobacteriota bacterium]